MDKKRTNKEKVCDLEASALAQEAKRMTLSRDHVACLSSQVAVVSPVSSAIDWENESVDSVSSTETVDTIDFDDLFMPTDPDTHVSEYTTAQQLVAEAHKAPLEEKRHYYDEIGCITTTPRFFRYIREVSQARDNLQSVDAPSSSEEFISHLRNQQSSI